MIDGVDRFFYVYSCDVSLNIQLKIGTLEGKRENLNYKSLIEDPQLQFSGAYEEGCSDLYVTCQVFADGKPLALPTSTSYRAFVTRWNWNEWITLPLMYSDLPRNAQACFTIWDVYSARKAIPVGGTTVSLFGKNGTFRQGMHDMKVWPGVLADGKTYTTTPGKTVGSEDEMARLAKLVKKHHKGHMVKVDWLDRLTFREIEMINEREKRNSNFMYLMIEFSKVHYNNKEFSIVYYDKDAQESVQMRNYAEIVKVPDPEMLMENLVEDKHHILVRSERSGLTDKDLKPNAATRDQLNTIVNYPPNQQITSEEKDLLWKFRFSLSNQKQALTKFLKSVKWNQAHEEKQAIEFLHKWSPIDVADALELLSPQFKNPTVRRYAVSRLKTATHEELLLYLLQLVQALKYEDFEAIKAGVEDAAMIRREAEAERERLRASSMSSVEDHSENNQSQNIDGTDDRDEECDLATFLINQATCNFTIANYFYWYLVVECDRQDSLISKDPKVTEMYVNVMKRFSQALLKNGKKGHQFRSKLAKQQSFVEKIVMLMVSISRESGNRKKKIDRLQSVLSNPDILSYNYKEFEPIPLPLHPEHIIKAIKPETATIFKSALMPCRLTFMTTEDDEYVVICKNGDDLRQDQLILQMIQLMDKLLRQENLDLKLTPYRVLATSSKHGLVQFVPNSTAVAEVLAKYDGNIQNFFRKCAPNEMGPYGIHPDVMDTYVKSCAGYCVITYLLGVGDRHLDNLLLTEDGKLFHIDFGYILGRDPKPLPPPMKLSKEMVEGMGGTSSEHYQDFKRLCYTSFLHLRRHANLILNLFSLMVDASVPDIALEPDKTVKKVQDKFRLDLTEEEAVHYMQNLIDVSVGAVFAAVVEQIHKFAQYWRR
ncbi:phosphatidylinositol 3-kinase catalytic subunit type 3-like [Antedon mediterranea]|uniref:phosphatidylinositol 3-kinase catalytic subunit type 3-like n=1 Tax=Antedon mediterranea TaxID=105859 RepID=UPI003AF7E981